MITKLHTMIVSQSLSWQRILSENLKKYLFIDVGDVVNGCLSAASRIKKDYPDLLVTDCTVSADDILALINHVRSVNTKTRIMIIADTNQQKREFRHSGADFVVSSFSCASEIQVVLNGLIESTM